MSIENGASIGIVNPEGVKPDAVTEPENVATMSGIALEAGTSIGRSIAAISEGAIELSDFVLRPAISDSVVKQPTFLVPQYHPMGVLSLAAGRGGRA